MFDANNEPRHKHPFYRLFTLPEHEVKQELSTYSREQLIAWLKWNDPKGIYEDEESQQNFGNTMSYEEGVKIIIRQIFHNSDDHDPAKGSVREPNLQRWDRML